VTTAVSDPRVATSRARLSGGPAVRSKDRASHGRGSLKIWIVALCGLEESRQAWRLMALPGAFQFGRYRLAMAWTTR
jgi:hypothetical protein